MVFRFVGDFETTTDVNDCRVWASCLYDIDTLSCVQLVNNIDDTMELLKVLTEGNKVELYYHNLKFDGEFILSWLYKNGFKYDEGLSKENTFNCLITDTGIFYEMKIKFHKSKHKKLLVIRDSLKIIPLSVEAMSKAFGLETLKGSIDYIKYRPINHILTKEEEQYIINDCKIVAQSLSFMFNQGLTKMTIASNAMNYFKKLLPNKNSFRGEFPILDKDHDDFIRKSYKGGYTYVNPKYQNKWLKRNGCTYDVNSLYPSQMHSSSGNILPYGMPVYFKGAYPGNECYPLYIIRFRCKFKLKKGFVPTIQLKNNVRFAGRENEYIEDSGIERVELTLTNVDFEIFKKHYNVSRLEFIDGYMFKGRRGIFDNYINHWNSVKEQATNEENEGMRTLAKLMLNSLYGRFAINIQNDIKIPVEVDGIVNTVSKEKIKNEVDFYDVDLKDDRERELNYTAMASFITAYARRVTQNAIQENYESFCYADTDSIHILGDVAKNIEIDSKKLGAWKYECSWCDAKFIRAKTYIEEIITEDGETHLDVKCAGMPDNVKKIVTKENFKIGFTTKGLSVEHQKLIPKKVKGGVVLVPTMFSII